MAGLAGRPPALGKRPNRRTEAPYLADLRGQVDSRLPALMRLYPQITPWNVWDLSVSLWLVFREITDRWIVEQGRDRG